MRCVAAIAALLFGCAGPSRSPAPTPSTEAVAPAASPTADAGSETASDPTSRPDAPADPLARPATSSARPDNLLLQVTIPNLGALEGAMRRYFAAVGPMLSALDVRALRSMIPNLVDSPQLDIPWDRPLVIFALGEAGARPRYVLASYSDATLERVGQGARSHREGPVGLVGRAGDVDRVRGYAARQTPVQTPFEVVLFPDAMWGTYGDEARALTTTISKGLGTDSSDPVGKRLALGMVQVIQESERIVLRLEVSGPVAELSLALEPRAKSALARFGAAQKPADHGLFAHLPPGNWSAAASGDLRMSTDLAELLARASVLEQASDDDDVDRLARQLWDVVAGHASAFAWGAELRAGGSEIAELIELRDAIAGARLVDRFDALTAPGWTSSKRYERRNERRRTIAGVPVRAMAVRSRVAPKTAPWRFRYGAVDGYVFGAGGQSADRVVKQLIASARRAAAKAAPRRAALPPGLTTALATSKARKESMVAWLDVAGLAAMTGGRVAPGVAKRSRSSGLVLGVAMSAKRIGVRITLPADQAAAAMLVKP